MHRRHEPGRRRGRGEGARRRRRGAHEPDARLADGDLHLAQTQLGEQTAELPDQLDDRRLGRRRRRPAPRHRAVATRPRYSPVRVSTLTTSPSLRKRGTWTTAPDSRVAGLLPPWAVSPRTPGSVLAMASSTKLGSSIVAGAPSM